MIFMLYFFYFRILLKESFFASITYSCQEFSARPSKNNPVPGKEI